MMNSVSLSIIIPVYNKDKYIHECLSSLLSQSYSDFEIIVIDDGSTDNSKQIISDFVLKDSRVNLFSGTNVGVSAARNKGIEYAQGEFIMFVDADDLIQEGYLQRIMSKTQEYVADIYIWGLTKKWNEKQEVLVSDFSGLYKQQDFLDLFVKEQYKTKEGLYGFVPNKLLRRHFINRFQIRFNTLIKKLEDYDFYLQCYSHVKTVYLFSESGYYYQMGTENSSACLVKKVDYLLLVDIHMRCFSLLQKTQILRGENELILNNVIVNLMLAAFLELKEVDLNQIKFLLLGIKSRNLIPQFRYCGKKWNVLYFLIKRKSKILIYFYLKVWHLYLNIRCRV